MFDFDNIYGTPPPSQAHSDTSVKAAEEIAPDVATLKAKVFRYLEEQQALGATDEEMQIELEMDPSTQRPRRIDLRTEGRVTDSGYRRKTLKKRNAVVWVISDLPGFVRGPHKSLKDQLAEAKLRIEELERENRGLRVFRFVHQGKKIDRDED